MVKEVNMKTKTRIINLFKIRADNLALLNYNSWPSYLASSNWKLIKDIVLKNRKQCSFCFTPASLVHHSSFDIEVLLGKDLTKLHSVCSSCHSKCKVDETGDNVDPIKIVGYLLQDFKRKRNKHRMKREIHIQRKRQARNFRRNVHNAPMSLEATKTT